MTRPLISWKDSALADSSRYRQLRGRETERIMAEYLRAYWPAAAPQAASLRGDDILNVGHLAIECKATAKSPILGALRQAHARATDTQIPIGIWRPNGLGPASVADWVVFTRVSTFFGPIASRAGYFND
jgi:hypothetical protein